MPGSYWLNTDMCLSFRDPKHLPASLPSSPMPRISHLLYLNPRYLEYTLGFMKEGYGPLYIVSHFQGHSGSWLVPLLLWIWSLTSCFLSYGYSILKTMPFIISSFPGKWPRYFTGKVIFANDRRNAALKTVWLCSSSLLRPRSNDHGSTFGMFLTGKVNWLWAL